MSYSKDAYEGYENRETWAVALHINNDQGWQESVHEALRAVDWDAELAGQVISILHIGRFQNHRAGEIIKDNVETELNYRLENVSDCADVAPIEYARVRDDIGSLWRVDWDELGALFLSDLREIDEA